MFLLDTLLVGGLRFVFDKVATLADQELLSVDGLQRQLVEAQMQLEEGAITDDEFADIERDVLASLRTLKGAQPPGLADAASFDGIEVEASVTGPDRDDGS